LKEEQGVYGLELKAMCENENIKLRWMVIFVVFLALWLQSWVELFEWLGRRDGRRMSHVCRLCRQVSMDSDM
jgi:hypothetical protein